MHPQIFITGTDTNIGKTTFAAALATALGASYWKPIQAGLEPITDSMEVARLSGGKVNIIPEVYKLALAASPHLAAEAASVNINFNELSLPDLQSPLVIEGAGGLLVPINRSQLMADLIKAWSLPVILCARTTLGTINHSLLSIEYLRTHAIPLIGIAFIGDANPSTEEIIKQFSQAKILGRLPMLNPLSSESLQAAFNANFCLDPIYEALHV